MVLIGGPLHASAFTVPPNDGFVTDATEPPKFTPEQEEALEAQLTTYREQTGNDIVMMIVGTLGGELPDSVVEQISRKWNVGGKDRPNGVIVLFAYDDKLLFIRPGFGLEHVLPNDITLGIIEKDASTPFRNGDYDTGLIATVEAIQKHISGEYTINRYTAGGSAGMLPSVAAFVFCAVVAYVVAARMRGGRWWMGAIAGALLGIAHASLFHSWLSIPLLTTLGIGSDMLLRRGGKRNRRVRRRGGW